MLKVREYWSLRENACTVAETDENAAGNNREICHCY